MKITARKIEELYVEYNKNYFDSCLVLPKIATYIGENSMGIFSVKTWKYKREEKISIARNFNLEKEEIRDLLLHEMIHQYVYEKYGKMSHGIYFVRKMNELNKTYGFDIRKNSKHLFKKYRKGKSLFEKIKAIKAFFFK